MRKVSSVVVGLLLWASVFPAPSAWAAGKCPAEVVKVKARYWKVQMAEAISKEDQKALAEAISPRDRKLLSEGLSPEDRRLLVEAISPQDRKFFAESLSPADRKLFAEAVGPEDRRHFAESISREDRRHFVESVSKEDLRVAEREGKTIGELLLEADRYCLTAPDLAVQKAREAMRLMGAAK